jgi:hypothetical protein
MNAQFARPDGRERRAISAARSMTESADSDRRSFQRVSSTPRPPTVTDGTVCRYAQPHRQRSTIQPSGRTPSAVVPKRASGWEGSRLPQPTARSVCARTAAISSGQGNEVNGVQSFLGF